MSLVMAHAEPHGAARRLPPEKADPPRNDERLTARFAAGGRDAAEEVVVRFTPRIARLVGRMLGWRSDVEDVVQDVFVAVLASRKNFRAQSQLETWIVQIAVNRCRAFHRRRLLRGERFTAWCKRQFDPEPNTDAQFAADLDRREAPPDISAITNEHAKVVRQTVANLPHIYREVVVLFYLEEMTAQETADALGLKRNTVEVRLSRARKMLTEMLATLD